MKLEKCFQNLEMEVLMSYLDGKSYQEIACDLDRHAKSIDNALQRVKRKLEKCLSKRWNIYWQINNSSKIYNWYIHLVDISGCSSVVEY